MFSHLGFDEYFLDEDLSMSNPELKVLDSLIGYRNWFNIRIIALWFHSTCNETLFPSNSQTLKLRLELTIPNDRKLTSNFKFVETDFIVILLT